MTTRKRDISEAFEDDRTIELQSSHGVKRSLAFRSPPPPSQPKLNSSSSVTQPVSHPRPAAQLILTPIDSSDEDATWPESVVSEREPPSLSDSISGSSESSSSSNRAIAGDDFDKMDMLTPPPGERRSLSPSFQHGRPRANDMLMPLRLNYPANIRQTSRHDRIPTPIYQTFGGMEIDMQEPAQPQARRTMLSPMMGEDDLWTSRGQLPSPAIEPDILQTHMTQPDTMMSDQFPTDMPESNVHMQHYSSSAPSGTSHFHHREHSHPPNFDGHADAHGRTARLSMGFRVDCVKCQNHVPGHYSHILWS